MELFDDFFEFGRGLHFLSRYAHILFGITWIGLLYFFNVVQVPAFAEMEATLFAQISGKLRRQLPELIDATLREHFDARSEPRGES